MSNEEKHCFNQGFFPMVLVNPEFVLPSLYIRWTLDISSILDCQQPVSIMDVGGEYYIPQIGELHR